MIYIISGKKIFKVLNIIEIILNFFTRLIQYTYNNTIISILVFKNKLLC